MTKTLKIDTDASSAITERLEGWLAFYAQKNGKRYCGKKARNFGDVTLHLIVEVR